jgi:hypothetical protein
MLSRTCQRRVELFLTIVLALAAVIIAVRGFNLIPNRNAREELRRFYESLSLGDEQSEVRNRFAASRFKDLRLVELEPTGWEVCSPNEFGSTNWILYIKFQDGKISSTYVRMADSVKRKPQGSPADRRKESGQ